MKRKPVTPEKNEAAYQRCLKRERDRERKRKDTKQGAFECSFVHFDMEQVEVRERQGATSWLSDRGKGARGIYRACDPQPKKPTRHQLLNRAQMRVSRHLPECLATFWLVIKNGNNEKESIWQIMKTMQEEQQNGMQKEQQNGRPQKRSMIHS